MGMINHHAIVITSWDSQSITDALNKAKEIGLYTTVIGASAVNGYLSFLVCPDGSKEGRELSSDFDAKRLEFKKWLRMMCSDDMHLEWVEISYSNDQGIARIVNDAWDMYGG